MIHHSAFLLLLLASSTVPVGSSGVNADTQYPPLEVILGLDQYECQKGYEMVVGCVKAGSEIGPEKKR
jgi:hypothetical protein